MKRCKFDAQRCSETSAEYYKRVYTCRPWSLKPYYHSASFLNGFNTNEKFIVTPLPNYHQINEFINMIFKQNVKTIVLPAPLLSNRDDNPFYYWIPSVYHAKLNLDYTAYISRTEPRQVNSIINVKFVSLKFPQIKRDVLFFEYRTWLNDGIPASIDNFWRLIMNVNLANGNTVSQRETMNPIIVHNDFIGCAGIFCALDICIDQYNQMNFVFVNQIVDRVCQGHYTNDITLKQYKFILEAMKKCIH
ncbi:GfV-B15-ORF1 [Ichnoviriform fumiferanae]|uniref:GfV-B15-ORF1 n=1 Tax=Ichnoviriform fumiferanae TaxID=419435 RepID=A2PZR3_9VIRU|nr:GfV-B15-ORF1 [Ichnoviriform fumiferanae]BAF45485.1 GfV-B15-ORF1 [Ichnoviriform fumiferanae]